MIDKVIDASAAAAIAFKEPRIDEAASRIAGCRLFAPTLLPFEMMNVCVKKIRAHPNNRDVLLQGYVNFLQARIGFEEIDPQRVIEAALRHGLSAYDASYLVLAEQRGIELVTMDARLARAAAIGRSTP